MKKLLTLLLALSLLAAVPALALAEEAAETPETTDQTPVTPWNFPGRGGQGGGRRNRPQGLPQTGFVDEDGDGVCDTCGQTPGQNPEAPGFADENADGICDHFGTEEQFQGRLGRMRGRMAGGQSHMAQGRGGMRGRGGMQGGRGLQGQVPGMAGGRRFVDENKDGVCDVYQDSTTRQPGGPRRLR